jgi:hypothetical protein
MPVVTRSMSKKLQQKMVDHANKVELITSIGQLRFDLARQVALESKLRISLELFTKVNRDCEKYLSSDKYLFCVVATSLYPIIVNYCEHERNHSFDKCDRELVLKHRAEIMSAAKMLERYVSKKIL